jgi:glycosyltransferase involved in cell wall biosynthesis
LGVRLFSSGMSETVTILTPLYNDWEALGLLLERIHAVVPESLRREVSVVVVNDCSTLDPPALPTVLPLRILHLSRNVGHQKAIALGLAYLAKEGTSGRIVVMDSDGEDRPEDIPRLVEASRQAPERIIFAHRSKRSEGPAFRIFYQVYKLVFRLLTGKVITFGNFSVIPARLARKLAHVSEIWNHFPGGIIRSRLPYASVPIERGTRLAGESKMNFVSLVLHGMSAISVHLDATAVRLLIASCLLIVLAGVGIVVVSFIRLFISEWAFPNWATTLVTAFFIVILQAFFISLFMLFTVLSYRTQRHFIPALDYPDFIERVETLA